MTRIHSNISARQSALIAAGHPFRLCFPEDERLPPFFVGCHWVATYGCVTARLFNLVTCFLGIARLQIPDILGHCAMAYRAQARSTGYVPELPQSSRI